MEPLPPYSLRESRRAKSVIIRVLPGERVEVVVPLRFDRQQLPAILAHRQPWILKTLARLQAERLAAQDATQDACPNAIHLRAIDHRWQVHYHPSAAPSVTLQIEGDRDLILTGPVDHVLACQTVLHQWLRQQGQAYLVPWLQQVSQQVGLPVQRISIRHQKTRWGSCSNRGTISLNDKLLFLPPALVHYVLIHELCHTQHLNHSAAFWALVAQLDPNSQASDRALKTASRYIPLWVHAPSP